MFARTLRGIWACSNPECDQVERTRASCRHRSAVRIPASTLSTAAVGCSSCCTASSAATQPGRLRRRSETDEATFLTSTPVRSLRERPRRSSCERTREYRWYRPGPRRRTASRGRSTHPCRRQAVDFGFAPATTTRCSARSMPAASAAATGSCSRGVPSRRGLRVPALPVRCPRCDLRTGNVETRKFFRGDRAQPRSARTRPVSRSRRSCTDAAPPVDGRDASRTRGRSSSPTAATTPPARRPAPSSTTSATWSGSSLRQVLDAPSGPGRASCDRGRRDLDALTRRGAGGLRRVVSEDRASSCTRS